MKRSAHATAAEQVRALPGDDLLADTELSMTHAITIGRPPHEVWAWIAQMGAGSRAGWYSYDVLDNRHHRSANEILPELQRLTIGIVFPALPGATDGFTLAAFEPDHFLILDFKTRDGTRLVTWAFVLEAVDPGSTRLIVRARAGADYRFLGFPRPMTRFLAPLVHSIMQRKQLHGIAQRAERGFSAGANERFRTPEGEAAFLAAYDAVLKQWPVPYEQLDIANRFGSTHVIVSGPRSAPPLVLLHGYMATSTMWARNIADFMSAHRVYAIDVMGQPGKSMPAEPVRSAADYVTWLTLTLDALRIVRTSLIGVSYGGWLAGAYALSRPERVEKLVLLSAGGLLPLTKEFTIRGMLMTLWPSRLTVNSCMRWLGIADADFRRLIWLGLKHFRMPPETARVTPTMFSDSELQSMRAPTLVLYGDHEVICDPAAALARARQLIPHVEGDLIAGCSHDMCGSQYRLVDARVLEFLKKARVEQSAA